MAAIEYFFLTEKLSVVKGFFLKDNAGDGNRVGK